jgi:hypothetical protein
MLECKDEAAEVVSRKLHTSDRPVAAIPKVVFVLSAPIAFDMSCR